jgi:hypothetical protein
VTQDTVASAPAAAPALSDDPVAKLLAAHPEALHALAARIAAQA